MRFYAELVIYIIMLINVLRVFIIKRVKQDALVILAPLSLLLSIAYLFAYELSVFSIQTLVLSIIVFVLNIHALWRKKDKLFVDYYSTIMKVLCGIATILIVTSMVFSFIDRPVSLNNKKLNITVNTTAYEGSFRTGFKEPEIFSERSLFITEYRSNMVQTNPKNVVVFIPDVRGDSTNYVPYLQLLASNGYTVCTADFFTSDCDWGYQTKFLKTTRSFNLTRKSIKFPDEYKKYEKTFAYNVKLGCETLLPMLIEKYGSDCKFFFVADGIASSVVKEFTNDKWAVISGTFYLDSIPEFNTSGYGCVEMTEPFVARRLGYKRDKDGFYTKYLVLKTSNSIIDAWSNF